MKPAPLSAALLVRKGDATRTRFAPSKAVRGPDGNADSDATTLPNGSKTRPKELFQVIKGCAAAAPDSQENASRPGFSSERAPAPKVSNSPERAHNPPRIVKSTKQKDSQKYEQRSESSERVRLSVRLDPETHRRLRLLAAYKQESIQDILAGAIEGYIEDISPELWNGVATYLANGRGKLN